MGTKIHQLKPDVREFSNLNDNDEIYITVQIGNGQIGGSSVKLENEQLAKGNLSQPAFLGNSSQLKNKVIDVITNVSDMNSFTNMCVITTSFMNQENKTLFTRIDQGEAPENGIASFVGKYKLTMITIFWLVSFLSSFSNLNAQKTAEFNSLETPSSPGFIILDKAPSSIERPTTPQGFGVNVLGLLQGKGGAMEVAPFWLMNHPKLTADQMYKNKTPILYNFSVSVATINSDSSSYVAGGFRTRLFQTYSKSRIKKLDSLKAAIEINLANLNFNNETELNRQLAEIDKMRRSYLDIIENPIFTLDFAGAMGGETVMNSLNNVGVNRWASWISLNYRPNGDDFYVTVLTRYINNEKFEDYRSKSDLIDLGTRFNYDISKFCLSLEYLQRLDLSKINGRDNRIAVVGSYAFSENMYLTTTLGKNFSQVNNIIALAGINFGVSNTKIRAF